MDNFLEYIFSFPIITFTIPLMLMIIFWIFALLGTIDVAILDPDIETESADGSESSFLDFLGLDGVPITVAVTLIEIYGFVFVYLAKKFITPLFDGILTATASGFVIAIFALVLAIPFAAYTSKPLRRVFVTHEAIEKSDPIGTYCIVTTQTVTENFGQARAENGMIYNVRTAPDQQIAGGSRIVLIDFNKDDDAYIVVTEAELMAMSSTQHI